MELHNNAIVLIEVFLVLFIGKSTQSPKELSLGDNSLCSSVTKRKVKYESLIVTQGRASQHPIDWTASEICKFEFSSSYAKNGGVIAVIQKLDLRKDHITGECIDYIQFRTKKENPSQRFCGIIDGHFVMSNVSVFPGYSFSIGNSFIDKNGKMDVLIYIAKQALREHETTEFSIVFTSYKECATNQSPYLKLCTEDPHSTICISDSYFGDGFFNCPYLGCPDESGCYTPFKPEAKPSIGDTVLLGSLTFLGIVFVVFILVVWAFKKHKLLCWAEEFARPTSTPQSNRNSRIQMNEQTGARLSEIHATAPSSEEDKDLPPSYESLFPNAASSN